MKRNIAIWTLIMLSCLVSNAQELIVKSFSLAMNDLTASTHRHVDADGKACALVKVQMASPEATFEGRIVGKVDYSQSEYLVYMLSGSKTLKVKLEGYFPLEILFESYGIPSLESLSTYHLVLTLSKGVNQNDQVGQLEVNYLPYDSEVWIDGEKKGMSPNTFNNMDVGNHSVEIRKEGYQSMSASVMITAGQSTFLGGSLLDDDDTNNTISSPQIEVFTLKGLSFKMIHVEGGTFMMGATSEQESEARDNEKPAHQVTLSSYSIGETEVTQELWEAVMGNNPSYFKGIKKPVENIGWNDCQEFIQKLNQLTGRNFRLPTEAEWEYAARGGIKGKGYKYSGSKHIKSVAWNKDNDGDKGSSSSFKGARDVKTKKANELGLYDMSGNLYEWCHDWFGIYVGSPQTNPSGPVSGSYRVLRGGCYATDAMTCRISSRFNAPPSVKASNIGFRLVLSE